MPVRPPKSSGGNYLGFKEVAIKGIENKVIPDVDICVDFILRVKGSDYDQRLSIFGSFEWDEETRIKENSFLKRIYRVLDGIGEKGGVNVKGMWVDENDNVIDDIEQYLSKYITKDETKYPYLAFIYQEKSKKDGKVYQRAYPMLVPNTSQGLQDISGYITYMRKHGYLKEYKEDNSNSSRLVEGALPKSGDGIDSFGSGIM